nr:MAG TPA: restriction endonuclease [Bacteriophage sp.]
MTVEKNNETKICKKCGRELPLRKFQKIYGKTWTTTCKDCVADTRMKKCYENGLALYSTDKSMRTKRKFKKIHSSRVLTKAVSGIDRIATDERFVRLLDYKDTWISNYGRAIVKDGDRYKLLRGSYSDTDGELYYTLDKNVYFKTKKSWGYRRKKIKASALVIQTFIVNYDMQNNTMIWHENNDVRDNYYRHIYPVAELQYGAIKQIYDEFGAVTESQIMDVINAIEYKPDNWNPWYFRRTFEGVGYLGTDDVDYNSDVYNRWKNMIQRCYNKKIHVYKPYYKEKSVCEEWHNFANFRMWYKEHIIPNEKVDLDKDLLMPNSNMYSPETCAFITHYLNTIFEDRGVKRTIEEKEDGFKVQMNILSKKMYVGIFNTKEDAYKGFSRFKEKYIKDLAESCKGKVQDCVYNAMVNWKVEITD